MTMGRIASESSAIRCDSGVGEASRSGHSPPRLDHETNKGAPFASRITGGTTNPSVASESPVHRQRTPSAFVFLSDRKSVPTELKNLQERTIKRRRDFVARMHEMVRICM